MGCARAAGKEGTHSLAWLGPSASTAWPGAPGSRAHTGRRLGPGGLAAGRGSTYLNQARLLDSALQDHLVPPLQVPLLMGVDLRGEGGLPALEALETRGRGHGQQLPLCEVSLGHGRPKLLAQLLDHGRGGQQVSRDHLPEPGAVTADAVDPGRQKCPRSASPTWHCRSEHPHLTRGGQRADPRPHSARPGCLSAAPSGEGRERMPPSRSSQPPLAAPVLFSVQVALLPTRINPRPTVRGRSSAGWQKTCGLRAPSGPGGGH